MTASFKAAGSLVVGNPGVDGGNRMVPWPAHVAGDIAILIGATVFVPTGGDDTLATPAGFTKIDGIQGGSDVSTINMHITAWWCLATSDAMASPVITANGYSSYYATGCIFTFADCAASPIDAHSTDAGDALAVSIQGATTTVANDLVCAFLAQWNSGATAGKPGTVSWANADLASMTKIGDEIGSEPAGNIGISAATGVKAAAGAYRSTTTTATNDAGTSSWAAITVALAPGAPAVAPWDVSQMIDEYDELPLELDKRGYDG